MKGLWWIHSVSEGGPDLKMETWRRRLAQDQVAAVVSELIGDERVTSIHLRREKLKPERSSKHSQPEEES